MRHPLACILLLLPFAAVALAQEKAGTISAASPAAATTSAPATRPAADRSSPEKTWAGVCAALKAGDLASFRAGFYNRNELAKMFLDVYSNVTLATFDLANAAALLGPEGQKLGQTLSSAYNDLTKTGQDHKSETDGDTARWIHEEKTAKGASQEIIYFKHTKGQWLIDTVETYALDSDAGREGAEKLLDTLPKLTANLKQIAADIRSKKTTTLEEMRHRLAAAG